MESSEKNTENIGCEESVAISSSRASSISGTLSDDSSEKTLPPSHSFLGSVEHAFIQAGLNLTTVAELTEAVEKCKGMFMDTKEYSEERKWLVRYLIELQMRLQEAHDAESEQRKLDPIGAPDLSPGKDPSDHRGSSTSRRRDKRIFLGHHFELQTPEYTVLRCDRCCSKIWGVLHLWYHCTDCSYKCHMRCVEKIKRQCAYVRVSETPFYSNDICPEVGLAAQNYRCNECKTFISFSLPHGFYYYGWPFSSENGWCEPRQCDYDGQYYCSKCHWGSASVIPARVVHNWDFTERKVCCNCFSFLRLMSTRPIINLDLLNPQLFQFVEDLVTFKKLRSQFMLIKQYLFTCKKALKEKMQKRLIWSLNSHLIESPAYLFSLQDLIDLHKCTLLPILQEVALFSREHIRNCPTCKEKGYYCELCLPPKKQSEENNESVDLREKSNEILFSFDDPMYVFVCGKCTAVFHRDCWVRKGNLVSCPRCERQLKRSLLQEQVDL